MIKLGLLTLLSLLWLQGCVGTVKMANDTKVKKTMEKAPSMPKSEPVPNTPKLNQKTKE